MDFMKLQVVCLDDTWKTQNWIHTWEIPKNDPAVTETLNKAKRFYLKKTMWRII
jgi:hypothetical protein